MIQRRFPFAATLPEQAAEIAAASAAALLDLPPRHRMAALHLGCEPGWASPLVGVLALSAAEAHARAQQDTGR